MRFRRNRCAHFFLALYRAKFFCLVQRKEPDFKPLLTDEESPAHGRLVQMENEIDGWRIWLEDLDPIMEDTLYEAYDCWSILQAKPDHNVQYREIMFEFGCWTKELNLAKKPLPKDEFQTRLRDVLSRLGIQTHQIGWIRILRCDEAVYERESSARQRKLTSKRGLLSDIDILEKKLRKLKAEEEDAPAGSVRKLAKDQKDLDDQTQQLKQEREVFTSEVEEWRRNKAQARDNESGQSDAKKMSTVTGPSIGTIPAAETNQQQSQTVAATGAGQGPTAAAGAAEGESSAVLNEEEQGMTKREKKRAKRFKQQARVEDKEAENAARSAAAAAAAAARKAQRRFDEQQGSAETGEASSGFLGTFMRKV